MLTKKRISIYIRFSQIKNRKNATIAVGILKVNLSFLYLIPLVPDLSSKIVKKHLNKVKYFFFLFW